MAIRAGETIAPWRFLQIYGANRVVREKPLELKKWCRKWQNIPL